VTRRQPAAVHAAARGWVDGQRQPARVVAAFDRAVYLLLENGWLLPVLGRDALRLPGSLVLAADGGAAGLGAVVAGSPAYVGGGRVEVAGLALTAGRIWRCPPTPPVDDHRRLPERLARLAGRLARVRLDGPGGLVRAATDLEEALRTGLPGTDEDQAVRALVGLGPGLTPSGDDVLAGALVALRRLRVPGSDALPLGDTTDRLAAAVRRSSERTTALSRTLLAHAARGDAIPPVLDLLHGLAIGSDTDRPLGALLAVGHTSGRDLAHGMMLGARVMLARTAPATLAAERRSA
jgi:Protein of unknown function (DUF2877)